MFAHFAFVCVTLSAGSEAAITNKPISSALCLELCAHACHQRHTVLPTVTQQIPCSFTSILPVFMWHRVDLMYSLQVATCCVIFYSDLYSHNRIRNTANREIYWEICKQLARWLCLFKFVFCVFVCYQFLVKRFI